MTGTAGRALLAMALAIAAPGPLQAADRDAAAKNNEGNRLYEGRQYDEAMKLYTDAQARLPNSPELHYNIGNVLFRKAEFDKAAEEYRKAEASPDPVLAQRATYNRGNALLLQQRPQEAVQAYVQALRARPDDVEAKRNLELALRMMQEQQKQQNQPQDPDQDKEKQDDQKPPQPSEANPQDQKPPQQTPPKPRPGQMSEEEARRLLEALREEEREGLRKHARAAVPDRRDPEKDW